MPGAPVQADLRAAARPGRAAVMRAKSALGMRRSTARYSRWVIDPAPWQSALFRYARLRSVNAQPPWSCITGVVCMPPQAAWLPADGRLYRCRAAPGTGGLAGNRVPDVLR